MANTTNERAMDWEDTIENESNFRIIPEGDYSFTVSKLTRARYNGGAKIGPCPKAILDLDVVTPEGVVTVQHNLHVHRAAQARAAAQDELGCRTRCTRPRAYRHPQMDKRKGQPRTRIKRGNALFRPGNGTRRADTELYTG